MPDLLAEGDVLLDRMRALGGADSPLPAEPGWAPRDEVKALFLATLDRPERLASIDITMFAMLATAATAWLPAEDALKLVVTNYLTVVEALGWTRPGWRSALAPRDTAPTTITETEIEDPAPNPYDYDAKLDRIAGLLSELGVTPDRMELALVEAVALQAFGFDTEVAATIGQELVERGLDVAEGADVVADCIVEADSLLRAIEPLRQQRDALQKEVGALSAERAQCRELLGDLSVDPGRVAALQAIDALVTEHNLDLAALLEAARDAAVLSGLKAEAKAKAVRKELGALKMTRVTQDRRVSDAQTKIRNLHGELAATENALAAARRKRRALTSDTGVVTDCLLSLSYVSPLDPLWQHLFDLAHLRAAGVPPTDHRIQKLAKAPRARVQACFRFLRAPRRLRRSG